MMQTRLAINAPILLRDLMQTRLAINVPTLLKTLLTSIAQYHSSSCQSCLDNMFWSTRRTYLVRPIFFFLHHLILTTANSSPTPYYYPVDDIAVNCGSFGNSIALDGREWTGDTGSQSTFSRHPNEKSVTSQVLQSLSVDPIPYLTVRISHSRFAYTFQVSPGQKFIRLHFYPALYPGFERSKAFFTVKAGAYTLVSNFSASLTADELGLKSFAKEFCVNIEENQALSITFSPSPSSTSDSI
ncbi:unnamed protein product [Camellia sinensis]